MASVSAEAIINLNVRNQASLQRTLDTTQKLNSVIRQLKPINLLAPGAGTGADAIRKNMRIIQNRAKAISSDVTQISATFAGAAGQASAFSDVLKNVKIEKLQQGKNLLESQNTSVKELAIAFVRAEAKAEDLQERFEELVRSAKIAEGLAAGPATQLDSIEAKTKKRLYYEDQIAEAKRQQEKASRESLRTEKKRTTEAQKASPSGRRGLASNRLFQDIATGGGFPLLMGGGPLSTIGGLAGGAFAGLGGSIVGSAIGQILERAASAANSFAIEATKASTSLETLIQKFGIVGSSTASSIRLAESLGIGAAGRAAAQGSLTGIVGESGVKNLELLGKSAEEAGNALSRFAASTTSALAPILTAFNDLVAAIFGGGSKVSQLEAARADLRAGSRPVVSGPGSEARAQFEASRTANLRRKVKTLEEDPETKAQLKLQQQIRDVIQDRIALAKASATLEENRLSLRRDSLASEKGALEIQGLQNKLKIINIQLEGQVTKEKRVQLELDRDLTSEAVRQAQAARENAAEEARRAIQKEQIAGAVTRISLIKQEQKLALDLKQADEGRFALFTQELDLLDSTFDANKGILDLQRKSALIGVVEQERVADINRQYDARERVLARQYFLDARRLEQANAAYRLSRLQVEQARELERIQAGISANQQIRQTSPFEQGRAFADPFFGGSSQLQAEQTLRYSESLGLLQARLKQVTDQQRILALAPEVREGLADQQKAIEEQIASFEKYQPAIDAAALAQSRFNEAMELAVPVTNSAVDNLISLVEGTKTAEQAFADFLRTIADLLFDAAKKMIAQYIALGIARAFAFGGGGGGGGSFLPASPIGIADPSGFNLDGFGAFQKRAKGGPVGAGSPYMVGERGPELFVPRSSGTIVPNNALGGGANVTVNVDASGSNVQGDSNQASQLGKAIGAAVQAELVKQKRPGGLLAGV